MKAEIDVLLAPTRSYAIQMLSVPHDGGTPIYDVLVMERGDPLSRWPRVLELKEERR